MNTKSTLLLEMMAVSDEMYVPISNADEEFTKYLRIETEHNQQDQEVEGPIESIPNFLRKSSEFVNPPLMREQSEQTVDKQNDTRPTQEQVQTLKNESTIQTQSAHQEQNIKKYLKNFLVMFSGWMRNYFINLQENGIIPMETRLRFENVIGIQSSDSSPKKTKKKKGKKRNHSKKAYINLKKLTFLFNDQGLKPHVSKFIEGPLLRYLMTSTTKQKAYFLPIIPRLQQGIIQGKITHLR